MNNIANKTLRRVSMLGHVLVRICFVVAVTCISLDVNQSLAQQREVHPPKAKNSPAEKSSVQVSPDIQSGTVIVGTEANSSVVASANQVVPGNRIQEREFRVVSEGDLNGNLTQDLVVKSLSEPASKFWIGVQCVDTDMVVKHQLSLSDGISVVEVVGDGPSANSLKQFDILVKADNRPLRSPDDLTEIVNQNGHKEIEFSVVRKSRPLTIRLTPKERPQQQLVYGSNAVILSINSENRIKETSLSGSANSFDVKSNNAISVMYVLRPGIEIGEDPTYEKIVEHQTGEGGIIRARINLVHDQNRPGMQRVLKADGHFLPPTEMRQSVFAFGENTMIGDLELVDDNNWVVVQPEIGFQLPPIRRTRGDSFEFVSKALTNFKRKIKDSVSELNSKTEQAKIRRAYLVQQRAESSDSDRVLDLEIENIEKELAFLERELSTQKEKMKSFILSFEKIKLELKPELVIKNEISDQKSVDKKSTDKKRPGKSIRKTPDK